MTSPWSYLSPMAWPKIFISYRRDDSGDAGRISDRLERQFGRDFLFIDVDSIPPGRNFVDVLREEVAKCGVLIAVIGPNLLNARDENGNRRLDNPNDFVRIEIATALQRKDTLVIPILLDGSRIPKADQLPEDLKELSLRNSVPVHHASFNSDMEKLIRWLKEKQGPTPKQMTIARYIARLLVLLLLIAILFLCSQPQS